MSKRQINVSKNIRRIIFILLHKKMCDHLCGSKKMIGSVFEIPLTLDEMK